MAAELKFARTGLRDTFAREIFPRGAEEECGRPRTIEQTKSDREPQSDVFPLLLTMIQG
jgi:hypothetical protein